MLVNCNVMLTLFSMESYFNNIDVITEQPRSTCLIDIVIDITKSEMDIQIVNSYTNW